MHMCGTICVYAQIYTYTWYNLCTCIHLYIDALTCNIHNVCVIHMAVCAHINVGKHICSENVIQEGLDVNI